VILLNMRLSGVIGSAHAQTAGGEGLEPSHTVGGNPWLQQASDLGRGPDPGKAAVGDLPKKAEIHKGGDKVRRAARCDRKLLGQGAGMSGWPR
jgi:hypothetical protein